MPQMKRLSYYGCSSLFVAITALVCFFIINSKDCGDYDRLKIIEITGTICGGVLFLLSFFNIAGQLYDIKIIFFAVVVAILIVGGVMFWGAYIAFTQPCKTLIDLIAGKKNAFEAEDGQNIAVFVLDIIAGLTLCSIGFTFAKRL